MTVDLDGRFVRGKRAIAAEDFQFIFPRPVFGGVEIGVHRPDLVVLRQPFFHLGTLDVTGRVGLQDAFLHQEPAESGQDQGEETSGVVRSAFTGTEYGTAVHRLLELFDYGKFTDPASVTPAQFDSWRTELAASAKIPPSYAEQLPAYGIMSFLHSSLAERMAAAFARGELYREQPFVLGIEADKVNPGFPKEETVLVQGIIDAYFEENGELVLVDYKTDAVEKAQDLIDRYRVQLDLYERALTQITGKNVKEKLIYSVSLKKTIPL